ncbi:MAG TPA: TolC family protein [Oscillatoriaceae cyanobacterium]
MRRYSFLATLLLLQAPALAATPVTLDQAVQSALETNPTYQKAELASQVAEQELRAARATFFPQLAVTGSYLKSSADANQNPTFIAANAPNETVAQLGLTQPIFEGGLLRATVARQQAQLAAAQDDGAAAANALRLQVVSDYVGVLRAEQALAIARVQLETALAHDRESRTQFKKGALPELDATNSALGVANAQLAVKQAEAALALARTGFATTTGLDPAVPLAPLPALAPQTDTLAALTALAITQRPDLRAARERTQSAQDDVRIARAALWPQVSLVGAAGWDAATALSTANAGWDAGVNLSMPLFDAGHLGALTQAAVLTAQQAARDEASVALGVRSDVASADSDMAIAVQQVALADKSATLAARAAGMTEQGYRLGAQSTLDFQLAQQALASAQRAQADARLNEALAIERLKWAMGETLP